jgi:signal transduction histidine kinase
MWPQSLGVRLLLFSGLGALLTGLFIGNIVVVWICQMRLQNAARLPEEVMRSVRECSRDPESWRPIPFWPLRIDAYDAATLAPRSPKPIPLNEPLYQRLQQGEEAPQTLGWLWGTNSRMLLKVPGGGSCGILQVSANIKLQNQKSNFMALLLFSLLAFGATLGMLSLWVVRPLLRRLRVVHNAAASVGEEGSYQSAKDTIDDDLGAISRILDTADTRLRQDAALLSKRARALEEHLADISHDVKTPLGALQLSLENALAAKDPKEQQQRVAVALGEVVYLGALLENLQLAQQFSSGLAPVRSARVNLGAILETVALRASLLAQRRSIEVAGARPDEHVMVRCDPTQVERALSNIAHNAVAYNKPGGHVALELTQQSDSFCLIIQDDGPGVLSDELSQLGVRTFRALEGRQRYLQGSGLGLSIACEVFRSLGWELTFTRNQPSGLKVELRGRLSAE